MTWSESRRCQTSPRKQKKQKNKPKHKQNDQETYLIPASYMQRERRWCRAVRSKRNPPPTGKEVRGMEGKGREHRSIKIGCSRSKEEDEEEEEVPRWGRNTEGRKAGGCCCIPVIQSPYCETEPTTSRSTPTNEPANEREPGSADLCVLLSSSGSFWNIYVARFVINSIVDLDLMKGACHQCQLSSFDVDFRLT